MTDKKFVGTPKKATTHVNQNEDLIFEKSSPGKKAYRLSELDVPAVDAASLLGDAVRTDLGVMPELSEIEIVRHFTRLRRQHQLLAQQFQALRELVAPFALSQPTISKHLKVLTRAGLIERRKDAQFRHCRLDAKRLEQAWLWLGDYHRFWEESFDRLEVLARELHAREKQEKPHARAKRKR